MFEVVYKDKGKFIVILSYEFRMFLNGIVGLICMLFDIEFDK